MRQTNSARTSTAYNTVYNVVTSHYRYAVQQLFMTKWSTWQLQSLWIGSLYAHIIVFASLTSTLEQTLENVRYSFQISMILLIILLVFCMMWGGYYSFRTKRIRQLHFTDWVLCLLRWGIQFTTFILIP